MNGKSKIQVDTPDYISAKRNIQVIQWGVGGVGTNVVKMISRKENLEVVGAIDNDPSKVGRDIVDIVEDKKKQFATKSGVIISDNADEVLSTEADCVVINTVVNLNENMGQISKALRAKKNVITTVGFMYPWKTYPEEAQQIDRLAKENGVCFLGTGVYPGFMNYIAPVLTGAMARVDHITVEYYDDITPFTTTADLMHEEFLVGIEPNRFDEIQSRLDFMVKWYTEVIYFIADYFGWELTNVSQRIDKHVNATQQCLQTACIEIEPGQTCGFKITCEGIKEDNVRITAIYGCIANPEQLNEYRYPGAAIWIDGRPPIGLQLKADLGRWAILHTAATTVNAVPLVTKAPPGLLTLKDLPPVVAI